MKTTRKPKLFREGVYTAIAAGVLLTSQAALAGDAPPLYQPDPDSPIGERNQNAAPELAQYDFLIGDWDVEITWNYPNQPSSTEKAKWHNHWIIDGKAVMLEWRGSQFTGAEIRSWHVREKKWVGVNLYPDFGGGFNTATSEKIGDKMYVTIPSNGPNGAYINRETYYDIEADAYKMKSEHSYDGGETWQPGLYEMTVWRSGQ